MCPHGGDCPPTGPKRLTIRGLDKNLIPPHLCRSIVVNRGIGGAGLDLGRRINSQVIGASDAAKPAEAGRIGAEWCPTRAMARRSSWPGRRRRAGGGVMATGHQVVAGAPASAEDAAAGPPVTPEHATRPGGPHGDWQMGGAQAGPMSQQAHPGYSAHAGYVHPGAPGDPVRPDGQVERELARTPPRLWAGSGGRWLVGVPGRAAGRCCC
jgi:hypothetical protein